MGRRFWALILPSLLGVAAVRSSHPPAGGPFDPLGRDLTHHRPGILYSTRDGREVGWAGLGFWLFTKSKKVWFLVDDVPFGTTFPHRFRYAGQPILHVSELPAWRARGGSRGRPVVWGDHVSGGWARGPQGTNFYLFIWTRWSLQHLAFAHPERFQLDYQPPGPLGEHGQHRRPFLESRGVPAAGAP